MSLVESELVLAATATLSSQKPKREPAEAGLALGGA